MNPPGVPEAWGRGLTERASSWPSGGAFLLWLTASCLLNPELGKLIKINQKWSRSEFKMNRSVMLARNIKRPPICPLVVETSTGPPKRQSTDDLLLSQHQHDRAAAWRAYHTHRWLPSGRARYDRYVATHNQLLCQTTFSSLPEKKPEMLVKELDLFTQNGHQTPLFIGFR